MFGGQPEQQPAHVRVPQRRALPGQVRHEGERDGQGRPEAWAASTGTSAGRQPSSRATQATEAPLDCVGPYSSGAGAQLPGTPNSRAPPGTGAPTMADVPLKTNPLPRSKHPAAKTCANASLQPTHTGTPGGSPNRRAAAAVTVPRRAHAAATGGQAPGATRTPQAPQPPARCR